MGCWCCWCCRWRCSSCWWCCWWLVYWRSWCWLWSCACRWCSYMSSRALALAGSSAILGLPSILMPASSSSTAVGHHPHRVTHDMSVSPVSSSTHHFDTVAIQFDRSLTMPRRKPRRRRERVRAPPAHRLQRLDELVGRQQPVVLVLVGREGRAGRRPRRVHGSGFGFAGVSINERTQEKSGGHCDAFLPEYGGGWVILADCMAGNRNRWKYL